MADFDAARWETYCTLTDLEWPYTHSPSADGGRYSAPSAHGNDIDVIGILETCITLVQSDDPVDRTLAYALLDISRYGVTLPAGTWCVFATYKNGFGGDGNIFLFSAHHTQEQAERWLPYVAKAYDSKNYDWQVGQRDDVAAHQLRHPGADPAACVHRG